MPHPAPATRRPEPTRRLLSLSAWTGGALLAVALLPFPAASLWPGGGYPDVSALGAALSRGLVRYWSDGTGVVGPDLAEPVAFWARFHAVKALLAVPLLVVAVLLGRQIWREHVCSDRGGRRVWLAIAGVVEAPLVLLAVLLVVANIQGAIAPLSSALGLIDLGSRDRTLATTLHEIRVGLDAASDQPGTPPLSGLVDDFAAYHAAMVWLGAAVTVVLAVVAVRLWRRSRRAVAGARRVRVVRRSGALASLAVAAAFALITAANLSTFAHPAPALLGFFQGGS